MFWQGLPAGACSARVGPNAPLAESEYARVSGTRSSGFDSRAGYQLFARVGWLSFALSQIGCGKANCARASAFAPLRAIGHFRSRRLNGRDDGPSSLKCRFESGREHQCCLLAVAQRQAHPVRNGECRRFESCRRDQAPVAQRNKSARLRIARTRVRILPGAPIHGAVTQKKECPPVEREVAGSSPVGAANQRRVTQAEE